MNDIFGPSIRDAMFRMDDAICGQTQVPARDFAKILPTSRLGEVDKLMANRFLVSIGYSAETVSNGLMTAGLALPPETGIFLLGTLGYMAGRTLETRSMNNAGRNVSDLFDLDVLPHLKGVADATEALDKSGFGRFDMNRIQTLASTAYSLELDPGRAVFLSRLALPIVNAIALGLIGDPRAGALVAGLGLLSFPFGEKVLRGYLERRQKRRAAESAGMKDLLESLTSKHLNMTKYLNAISLVPYALFALKFTFPNIFPGNLLASLNGIKDGLTVLTGMMSFQRRQSEAVVDSKLCKSVLNSLVSEYLLVTESAWKKHIKSDETKFFPRPTGENSVIIENFRVHYPNGKETKLNPLSVEIPAGESILVKGASGDGKTILAHGLAHFVDHSGELVFVRGTKTINAHDFKDRSDLDTLIKIYSRAGILTDIRIADLFRSQFLVTTDIDFQDENIELALKMSDGLLKSEIANLRSKHKSAIFEDKYLTTLADIVRRRDKYIKDILEECEVNITDGNYCDKLFNKLSEGQKNRVLLASVLSEVRSTSPRLIILDEPLDGLDKYNADKQINVMKKILRSGVPAPSLIIISQRDQEFISFELGTKSVFL